MATQTVHPLSANPAEVAEPKTHYEQLELARHLFQEFRAQCFWHCSPNLEITEEHIPLVVKGLRSNGGHRGFLLAAKLLAPQECR